MAKLITKTRTVTLPNIEGLGYSTNTYTDRLIELETLDERQRFIDAVKLMTTFMEDTLAAKEADLAEKYRRELIEYEKAEVQYQHDLAEYMVTNVIVRTLFRTAPTKPHTPHRHHAVSHMRDIEILKSFPTSPHLLYDPVPEWLFLQAAKFMYPQEQEADVCLRYCG